MSTANEYIHEILKIDIQHMSSGLATDNSTLLINTY